MDNIKNIEDFRLPGDDVDVEKFIEEKRRKFFKTYGEAPVDGEPTWVTNQRKLYNCDVDMVASVQGNILLGTNPEHKDSFTAKREQKEFNDFMDLLSTQQMEKSKLQAHLDNKK